MAAPGSELRLGKRFGGPPGTANGGYACGRLAALLGGGTAEVLGRMAATLGVSTAASWPPPPPWSARAARCWPPPGPCG
jgi:hypothetical protein